VYKHLLVPYRNCPSSLVNSDCLAFQVAFINSRLFFGLSKRPFAAGGTPFSISTIWTPAFRQAWLSNPPPFSGSIKNPPHATHDRLFQDGAPVPACLRPWRNRLAYTRIRAAVGPVFEFLAPRFTIRRSRRVFRGTGPQGFGFPFFHPPTTLVRNSFGFICRPGFSFTPSGF